MSAGCQATARLNVPWRHRKWAVLRLIIVVVAGVLCLQGGPRLAQPVVGVVQYREQLPPDLPTVGFGVALLRPAESVRGALFSPHSAPFAVQQKQTL